MTSFREINNDISNQLISVWYENGDLSDVGNEIGIVIARYFKDECGYDLESFLDGLKHGISLTDGTHDR